MSIIRVAYDASILGAGYLNPKARTGIFRLVESLFKELLTLPELDIRAISFDAETTIWEEIGTQLYFNHLYPQYADCFQKSHHSHLHLRHWYTQAVLLQRSLIHASAQYPPLYKLGRLLQIISNQLALLETKPQFNGAEFDLYHALFFPLPSHQEIGHIPRILTIYDLIPILFPKFVIPVVHRRCVATLKSIDLNRDWVICISEHTKQDFCNYTGMNPDRVFVTPLAAADFLQPVRDKEVISSVLQRYGIQPPYLLSLATLEPRKNLSLLIQSFCQLVQQQPDLDLNLVLVGVSGWKNSEIFQVASQQPELRARIKFTGYLPDADLSALYSGAIAFVYPSLYEGFGLPPLEAMQCGTPVITSNTSSLPEVVGDAGILIDPQHEDDLCQAIFNVAQDAHLRANLSRRAVQRASHFNWKKCAHQTAQVYQLAAANRLR